MNLRLQRDREAQAAQRARLKSLMREREARDGRPSARAWSR